MPDDRRRLLLRAALGFLRLPPTEPELQLLHRWLDTWTGVGLITVGVERHGMRLSLSHIAEGEWRCVFMGDSPRLAPEGYGVAPTPWRAVQRAGGEHGGHTMMQLARSAPLVALLLVTSVATASAECACLPLRTFTPEERQQFETQYGVNWWKAMGLIPGPQTPADWVERPAGDSSIIVFSPQQFWDPRACASNTIDRRGPKGK